MEPTTTSAMRRLTDLLARVLGRPILVPARVVVRPIIDPRTGRPIR